MNFVLLYFPDQLCYLVTLPNSTTFYSLVCSIIHGVEVCPFIMMVMSLHVFWDCGFLIQLPILFGRMQVTPCLMT